MLETLTPGMQANLTVLGASQMNPVRVSVEEFCDIQLRLRLDSTLPFAAAVKVENDQVLLLGDITYCEPDGAHFRAGVTVRHRLSLYSQLTRLNAMLAQEAEAESARPGRAVEAPVASHS